MGRWTAPLDPGNYTIHILKSSHGENSPHIEDRYLVEIPSSKMYELPIRDVELFQG
jgi:hypothetical protein